MLAVIFRANGRQNEAAEAIHADCWQLGCPIPPDSPLTRRLTELGWIEGQNLVFECVSAVGSAGCGDDKLWREAQVAIKTHVIHAANVAVAREHRRAKTDRLDTEQLKRAFLGRPRGEREHCKMCAIVAMQMDQEPCAGGSAVRDVISGIAGAVAWP